MTQVYLFLAYSFFLPNTGSDSKKDNITVYTFFFSREFSR